MRETSGLCWNQDGVLLLSGSVPSGKKVPRKFNPFFQKYRDGFFQVKGIWKFPLFRVIKKAHDVYSGFRFYCMWLNPLAPLLKPYPWNPEYRSVSVKKQQPCKEKKNYCTQWTLRSEGNFGSSWGKTRFPVYAYRSAGSHGVKSREWKDLPDRYAFLREEASLISGEVVE